MANVTRPLTSHSLQGSASFHLLQAVAICNGAAMMRLPAPAGALLHLERRTAAKLELHAGPQGLWHKGVVSPLGPSMFLYDGDVPVKKSTCFEGCGRQRVPVISSQGPHGGSVCL